MTLIHTLFHLLINRSCKYQGCSSIYTGMAKDLGVPVLSVTLGINLVSYKLYIQSSGFLEMEFMTILDILDRGHQAMETSRPGCPT